MEAIQTLSARACYESAREADGAGKRVAELVARLRREGRAFPAEWHEHEVRYWNRVAGEWYVAAVRRAAVEAAQQVRS